MMKLFQKLLLTSVALVCLAMLNSVFAGGKQIAEDFIDYWNAGQTRGEQNEEIFTPGFIARQGDDGIAQIMDMVYGDSGEINLHSIDVDSLETIQFLVSSQQGPWLDISLKLAADQKVDGFGIDFTGPPPKQSDKGMKVEQIATAFEQYVNELAANGEFSGSVLLAMKNEPVFAKSYGMADRESKRPNTLGTPINLGSMNKMFTGLAISQLVAQGKLKYTDTVGQFLPDYPNEQVRNEVTVHQLLTHTSGLGSYWNPAYAESKNTLQSTGDFARLFENEPLIFDPGTGDEYSNAGPVVLGLIIEAITGQDYYDYIRQHVYQPAAMEHSDHYDKFENISGKATGYFAVIEGGEEISNFDDLGRVGSPAGGGYASANDLLKFATALYDGTLIDPDHREQMTTMKTPDERGGYAYLYLDGRINGKRYIGHNGGAPGISAEFAVFPDSGYVLIVLANNENGATAVAYQVRQWIGYASDS
jgi:CubicO group peptidase (beta-lactamase class C family)